jgi:pimeloyl-ACP methyl ester carboxylesterase
VASYAIPDLEGGDFSSMTMDRMQDAALAALAALPADDQPVILIGSSLGAYTAALLAAHRRLPRVAGLVLIAPAFGFTARWATLLGADGVQQWRNEGRRLFHHHARNRDEWLSVAFLDSCADLPQVPGPGTMPVVVIHGRQDQTVDWRFSRAYADQEGPIELHLVEGDHRLTAPRHEDLITWCTSDLIALTVTSGHATTD